MTAKRELTPKQQRFVDEYLVDLNATQAAIRAGYSEKTARQTAAENLSKPDIADAIQEAREERAERTGVTADRVLQELARLGFSDLRSFFGAGGSLKSIHDLDDDAAAAVSSVEVITRPSDEKDEDGNPIVEHTHKIKLWDKGAALDKMAKHLGMFIERHEHSGSIDLQGLYEKVTQRTAE